MYKLSVYVVTFFALMLTPSSVQSQVCGDLDGDGIADIDDFSIFIDYLAINFNPPLLDPAVADLDGRKGITPADLIFLQYKLFIDFRPLDCSQSNTYSYGISVEDTVILPWALCVSDAVTDLSLPVELRLASSTISAYLPIDPLADGSNGKFKFQGPSPPALTDTALFFNLTGGNLNYVRQATGFAIITTGAIDIDRTRQFTIVKDNGDLMRPVVLYRSVYDHPNGDANCDCLLDVRDLVAIINRLYIDFQFIPNCPEVY